MCEIEKDPYADSHGLERSLKRPVSRDVYDAIKEKIGNE